MSTRSVIVVTGKNRYGNEETIRLYKHSDGYPSSNLPIIASAVKKAVKQCEKNNRRFKRDTYLPVAPQVAGLIIGEASSVYGMGASPELQVEGSFKPEHLGDQWDVEFTYIIDLDLRQVRVYSGDFQGGIQSGYAKGTIDVYVDTEGSEHKKIESAVNSLINSGYGPVSKGIKPKKFKKPKSKGIGKPDLVIYSNK